MTLKKNKLFGCIVIAIKNYTCEIDLVRFVVAQFITRLLSDRALRATGGRDREIAPTINLS